MLSIIQYIYAGVCIYACMIIEHEGMSTEPIQKNVQSCVSNNIIFNNIIYLNITDHTHHTLPNITLSFQSIIVCIGMAFSLVLRDIQLSWKQQFLSLFIVDKIAQVLLCKQNYQQ